MSMLVLSQRTYDYIVDCGSYEGNLEQEVDEVRKSYGRLIFSTGDSDEEEIRTVYAILNYIVENKIDVYRGIAFGYSSSKNYQDIIKGFNDRFVMVLIRHIERYLTKVGIDMGLDDKKVFNVSVQNGQAIIISLLQFFLMAACSGRNSPYSSTY